MAITYSGLTLTDDDAVVAVADAEPQAGDITLEVTDEEITEIRIAPVLEAPPVWTGPYWGAYQFADWMTPQTDFLGEKVQYKTTERDEKWVYTGMTPEQMSTAQTLTSQEALHQQLRNPSTPTTTKGELLDLTGGVIPKDTTDQDGGGLLDIFGDLFSGLTEGSGDWWKYILYAIIGIIAVVIILSVVGK